ncbi:MAG: response regulator transcription factor, partial [Bacteroidota bacterium]
MTKKTKAQILLVEDDPNLGMVVQDYLEMMGYACTLSQDGEAGLFTFSKHHFDLCIFDVMMPKMDGFSLAEAIRKKGSEVPIIFLTAKALKDDRIQGFRSGGDDYLTKPFSTEELHLRIEAILRRTMKKSGIVPESPVQFQIGKLLFDPQNMFLQGPEKKQSLTRREAQLLQLLCENMNNLITREFALKTIWGDDDYFIGRSMDVFITRLRKYLKEDPSVTIQNV